MNLDDIRKWMVNLPISRRLLYGYLVTFLIVVAFANIVFFFYFRSAITHTVEAELGNSLTFTKNLIQSSSQTALKNQLKLIVDNNIDIIIGIYQQNIPEREAKERVANILQSQSVGKNGSFYVVNSFGIVQAHPEKEKVGQDISSLEHVARQIDLKHGYLEYTQAEGNGDDGARARKKALYMSYFGPWDWIVTATLAKKQSQFAPQQGSINQVLQTRKFGRSGYVYIVDTKGNAIIHPTMAGENIYDLEDANGRRFIEEMCATKNGRMQYSWSRSGQKEVRRKVVLYQHIPELDWIVAASGYRDELYAPLTTMATLLFVFFLFLGVAIFLVNRQISHSITKPIKYLTAGLKSAATGDFSTRLSPTTTDELGRLERYFNTFIAQLQESNARLHQSERSYRSIFENSVEGIFQFDLEGHIHKVNPSFVAMLGYSSGEALLEGEANLPRDFMVQKELWKKLLEHIISERAVKGLELQIYRKSGKVFWCLLNARGIYEADSDKLVMIEGCLSDINAQKVAQQGQEKMMEDLESMVEQRTVELSNRVAELEQRDQLNRYMAEMADMLQSCRSVEETFPVINQYLRIFFPRDRFALYLHDAAKKMIDRVVPPPTRDMPFLSMTNDSCWALRLGKNYHFNHDMDQELTCGHVEEAPHGYICIPLIAHGVTMGLLHIVFEEEAEEQSEESADHIRQKTRLFSRLAEHLSLALANLSLQEKLKLKSIQDSLTGLANRRHMEEILQRQFFRLFRYNTPCSIIMLDVDHFKKFNDSYGHDMGDYVLKELAAYLKKNTRGEDLACRYGGEEFIIILVDTETEAAARKAERMRGEIAETIAIPYLSEELHVTVSMGVATSPHHGRNINELIKAADTALYKAKENGRNRVEITL